jgi:hypothetical protein
MGPVCLSPIQSGGNAESTVNPRRSAICGYFASSREKFLRALAGEMFGYALGCLPISAQRFIFLASRCSRICGRACILIFLQTKPEVSALRDMTREPVFAAKRAISCVRPN